MPPTLDDLRRFAVTRSLFHPATLKRALDKLAFVQADPIRAPARAQDLTLRHRVTRYSAGDLERLYPTLDIEEDFFINYGYVTRRLHALMHPRVGVVAWGQGRGRHGRTLLEFVRERGLAHPREVDAHFARGTVTNYWGGSSNATTHLLGDLHYRGELRVAGRDAGIRIYAPRDRAEAPVDAAARGAGGRRGGGGGGGGGGSALPPLPPLPPPPPPLLCRPSAGGPPPPPRGGAA